MNTILQALADCIGLGTIVEIVQARRRGDRVDIFTRPFYLGADAAQLGMLVCAGVGIYQSSAPWLVSALACGGVLAVWGWCWGFFCHPRRTRLGERVDDMLAPLFDPEPRKGRR